MTTSKHYDFGEGLGSINFVLTEEGLIIDVYDHRGEPVATAGMMADEWAHWVLNNDPLSTRGDDD